MFKFPEKTRDIKNYLTIIGKHVGTIRDRTRKLFGKCEKIVKKINDNKIKESNKSENDNN